MATKPDKSTLKDGLRAVWKSGQADLAAARPAAPVPPPDKPPAEQIEDDLALFRDALRGVTPLPAVDRVELPKKPARRIVPPRSATIADRPPAKRPGEDLPAHWRNDDAPPRPLPEDPEAAALLKAMAGVVPLPGSPLATVSRPAPAPRPRQSIAEHQATLHDSLHAPIDLQDRLEGGDEPLYLRPGLAITVLRDLRRGRWVIQDEIDLHGLNREQARQLVTGFLQTCLHQGKRCVRIVHGKGHGSPQKQSILRQLVRGWLAQRIEVLAYCQARPHDGGEGALLVLLRSTKKPRAT